MQIKNLNLNEYIMALFIFQFGLLQPLALLANSQWPIAVFTAGLLFIMVLNNGLKVKKNVLMIFLAISIYFFINALVYTKSTDVIIPILVESIIKCFSAFLIGSLDIDGEDIYNVFLKVAVLNFMTLAMLLFLGLVDEVSYMRYGYAMTPSVIMFFYAYMYNDRLKPLWLMLGATAFMLTVVYGSRGPIAVFTLLGMNLFLFSKKISAGIKSVTVILSTLSILIINKYSLLINSLNYIYNDLNIKTYSIEKLIMMLNIGLAESSSGRDAIYVTLWKLIKQNVSLGYGIGFSQISTGYTAHNLLLQILLESGIIGLVLWIFIWSYCFKRYYILSRTYEVGLFRITTMIIAISVGRLLLSSDMWLRPEYWFVLSLLINYRIKPKYTGVES